LAPTERVEISLAKQELTVFEKDQVTISYPVSTSKNGPGESTGSECTPRGRHEISEKIGTDYPLNTIFVGRKVTGEIFEETLIGKQPYRDWILTRILWLSGLEPGYNAGAECDTKARYIYIHGSPESTVFGTPGSRGCIRMRNLHVMDLFDRVEEGTWVDILD